MFPLNLINFQKLNLRVEKENLDVAKDLIVQNLFNF